MIKRICALLICALMIFSVSVMAEDTATEETPVQQEQMQPPEGFGGGRGMRGGMGGRPPQMPQGERPAMPDGEMPAMADGEIPAMPEGEMPQMPEGEFTPPSGDRADRIAFADATPSQRGVSGFLREYTTPIVSVVLLALAFVFVIFYKRKMY